MFQSWNQVCPWFSLLEKAQSLLSIHVAEADSDAYHTTQDVASSNESAFGDSEPEDFYQGDWLVTCPALILLWLNLPHLLLLLKNSKCWLRLLLPCWRPHVLLPVLGHRLFPSTVSILLGLVLRRRFWPTLLLLWTEILLLIVIILYQFPPSRLIWLLDLILTTFVARSILVPVFLVLISSLPSTSTESLPNPDPPPFPFVVLLIPRLLPVPSHLKAKVFSKSLL